MKMPIGGQRRNSFPLRDCDNSRSPSTSSGRAVKYLNSLSANTVRGEALEP